MNHTPKFGIRANRFYEESRMAKKATNEEMGVSAPSLKLSKMNCRVWLMTMEVYLDSHDLWQSIVGESASKKKDRHVLLVIISGVLEDLLGILDAKKTSKENWEILHQRNLGMDKLIPSRI